MSAKNFKIQKMTPAIGAKISGIDLMEMVSDDLLDAVYEALIEHQVIFFRNQPITPAGHKAFAESFGEPEPPHPVYPHLEGHENIVLLSNGPDNPPDTNGWHTDHTFRQEPPFASFLMARKVPEIGGDTLWLSLTAAYEGLPEGLKSELEEMRAVHDLGDFRNTFASGESGVNKVNEAHRVLGSAVHPVVQVHPVSGRKFLYVNEGFTQHLVGLGATESNRLLAYLYQHMQRPEYQVRFRWSKEAMAIWDNRCTCHYATADYLPQDRVMHRITVVRDSRVQGT